MTPKQNAPISNKPKSEDGQARSAEALRANLLKRKAQAKARTSTPEQPSTAPKDQTSS